MSNKEKLKQLKREYQKKYRKARKEIKIYYTPDEHKELLTNCQNAGKPVREFVKQVSLRRKIKPIDPNEKFKLEYKAEVRRIGNNLNQIAKYINQKYLSHDYEKIGNSLMEIDSDLKTLIRLLS